MLLNECKALSCQKDQTSSFWFYIMAINPAKSTPDNSKLHGLGLRETFFIIMYTEFL